MRDFVRSGKTIVLTPHYMDEPDALAGRIAVIEQGAVIAAGRPR